MRAGRWESRGKAGDLLSPRAGRVRGGEQRDRLDREIAALDEPFVVLLGEQRAGEPDDGLVLGEDPDDVGAAGDLLLIRFIA